MDELTQYIIALTNLYGLVSMQQVLDIYNSQNNEKISLGDLENELDELAKELEENFIFIEQNLFVHEAIYIETESPQEIFDERSTWPYYMPEKEELLKYVDEYYFEKNDYYLQIETFITEKVTDGNAVLAEEIAREMHDHLSVNFNDVSGAFEIISDFGYAIDDNEIKGKLRALVANYAISMRTWDQNGLSLIEMNEKLRERAGISRVSLAERYEQATHLEKYIISLTHLYGRVAADKVAEIYNLQNDSQITVEEVKEYLTNPTANLENGSVYVKLGEFVTEDVEMFEGIYEKLVEDQKGRPSYIPEQEELFNYFDYNYTEQPKEYIKLHKFLTEKVYGGDSRKAQIRAEDVQLNLQMGEGIDFALDVFADDDFIFDDKKLLGGIANHVKRLHANTRIRNINGLTPRELSRFEKEQRIQRINMG